MQLKRKNILTLLITLSTIATFAPQAGAIDLTPFYRATLFQGEPKQNIADWATHLDVRYTEGSTNQSWNQFETKTHLFNDHGPFDLRKLAANLENIDSYPKTKAYLNGDIPNLYDGKIAFKGNFNLKELDITIQQNIFSSIYFQVHLPIRETTIDTIDYCQTVTTEAEQTKIANFIDNDLDDILTEHGIKPLKTNFDRTELSDILVSAGWNGNCSFPKGSVSAIRGFLQAGALIPTAKRNDIDQIFSIGLGSNKHWGFNARGCIHATFFDKIVFGLNVGGTIFAQQTYDQRMTTSTLQNGRIILAKGEATKNPGTQWDVTGYLKAERIVGGFSTMASISYTQQEKSELILKDDAFLQTALNNETIKNKNEVINTNKLLNIWYQYVLHTYAEYDFGTHTNLPASLKVRIEYHLPLLAKHTWNTAMFGGSLGLSVDWRF